MQWLEAELEESRTQSQRVIVLCHVLVHPETSKEGKTLLWNYDQLLEVIRTAGKGVVAAVLSGHQHEGGYHLDEESGAHFVVMESPLLASEETKGPFAVIRAHEDCISLIGSGRGKAVS